MEHPPYQPLPLHTRVDRFAERRQSWFREPAQQQRRPLLPLPQLPIASETSDDAICCVICGMPLLPTVYNGLLSIDDVGSIVWMQAALLRPRPGFHGAMKTPSYAHAYQRCDEELLEVIIPITFVGGGAGFRVVVPVDGDEGNSANTTPVVNNTGTKLQTIAIDAYDDTDYMPVPLHKTCLKVARRFCAWQARFELDFRAPGGGEPSSLGHLWELWMKRMLMTMVAPSLIRDLSGGHAHSHPRTMDAPALAPTNAATDTNDTDANANANASNNSDGDSSSDDASTSRCILNCPISNPQGYRGAPQYTDLVQYALDWHEGGGRNGLNECRKFFTDPDSPILGMEASAILFIGKLRMIPDNDRRADPYLARLVKRFEEHLPQELQDRILNHVEPFINESLVCTRALPPTWWRNMLFSGRLIPWLWDLTPEFYEANCRKLGVDPDDDSIWDWELLARQLSQSNVFEAGGLLDGNSEGLWNRHRIWMLLSQDRNGHLSYLPGGGF